MCDPLSLGGVALSALGGASQARTQQNYANAVNAQNKKVYDLSQKARADERFRQQNFEQQAADTWATTQGKLAADDHDTAREGAEASFLDLLQAQPQQISTETRLPGQEAASVSVKDAIAGRINAEAAETRKRIQAFAKLTAYGRAGEQRATDLGSTGDALSTLGGLRRGSLAVANQEQNIAPATVRPGSSALGDILSGVGGIMSYGGPGLFSGFGAKAPGGAQHLIPTLGR